MPKIAIAALALLVGLPFAVVAQETTLSGLIYHDADRDSKSAHDQQMDGADRPLPGIEVRLFDGVRERRAETGLDGVFEFAEVSSGTYLLDVGIDDQIECTTANHPRRVPAAVREGAIHIVTIGDSIGAQGSDVLYPERLANRFAPLADATFTNLAIGGTTTFQWLPGADTGYFDDLLAPVLPGADVLTITLGVNDLVPYVEGMPPYNPVQIIRNFLDHPEYIFGILPNLITIIGRANEINPNCDVVFVVYPNIADSQAMIDWLGALQPLASFAFQVGMRLARGNIGDLQGVVIADMYGALGDTLMDPYLSDIVHPNDQGHQLYADVIFAALGGVVIEAANLGEERSYGFFAPDLVPADDDTADDTGDDDSLADDADGADDDTDGAAGDDTTSAGDDAGGDDDNGACGC